MYSLGVFRIYELMRSLKNQKGLHDPNGFPSDEGRIAQHWQYEGLDVFKLFPPEEQSHQ
jgi:hypothetical protein